MDEQQLVERAFEAPWTLSPLELAQVREALWLEDVEFDREVCDKAPRPDGPGPETYPEPEPIVRETEPSQADRLWWTENGGSL